MLIAQYGSKDFETQTDNAIQAKQPFIVQVNGWKKRAIKAGLPHYLRYLDTRLRGKTSLATLRLIPFGFITPTFWVLCVRAQFERMYPSIQQSTDALVIRFDAPA